MDVEIAPHARFVTRQSLQIGEQWKKRALSVLFFGIQKG
jgi:hypothetical protein